MSRRFESFLAHHGRQFDIGVLLSRAISPAVASTAPVPICREVEDGLSFEIRVIDMLELTDMRRLLEDRRALYERLWRVGFVPDKDMRTQLQGIRDELYVRITHLEDEIVEREINDCRNGRNF